MKKNGILIFILVILLIAMAGMIGWYLGKQDNDNNNNTTNKISATDTQVQERKELKQLDGYYKMGQIYETEDNLCDAVNNLLQGITAEILFNNDGTYKYADAADCGGKYYSEGTYEIENNILTLHCNDDVPTKVGCTTYNINEDGKIKDKNNNLFSKVSQKDLQILNKIESN